METLFSKKLSKTDITARLAVPTGALDHFSFPEEHDHYEGFVATDTAQNQWKFRLSKRQIGNHPKPVITGEWLKFVKKKDLKKGDKVILYKLRIDDEAGGVHYGIVVKKKTKQLI